MDAPETAATAAGTNGAAFIPGDYVVAVDHVGIAVADLDTAIAWYAENLGMVETHREINEGQGVHEAMLSLPGAPDDATALQLLAPLNAESTIAKFLDRNGPGLQQLAYRVTDLDAVCAHLRGRGLRLLYDEPRSGTAGSRINFLHPKDAGGVLVELVEPDANVTH
ncbi:methylmalonyl-CoA epimerase [Nocardia panacis]|uniref:Methylmalonyl-CoA epimerase n=1 Tax=Nocardia panacis TaxID=2340916 RepID=A0A3A4KLP5_9NOCA|nr:methylmalonyl-CoA epimerase [Nocardia panacis]RJO73978.1 methylmalonyl-CoA epimerase [Nocardia panacis]